MTGAVRVLTAAEEWLAHVEDCEVCGAGTSCADGEKLLRQAADTTAVNVLGLLIDVSGSKGSS